MDKKTIMKMNDSWKDFRLTEASKIMVNGVQHGFDLTDFKPRDLKRFLTALGIPKVAKGSSTGVKWSAGKTIIGETKTLLS